MDQRIRNNRLHHPLHALAIALRRRTALPMRRRARIIEQCSAAVDLPGLRALARQLGRDECEELSEVLAPADLPGPPGWEPVGLLGRGGMGEAWLCGRPSGELAVLKTLRPDLLSHAQAQARFRREIAATVALRHRNVVTALDADPEAGWMLLEFVAGGDLRMAVQVGGPLTEADALAVAAQVAQGLAAFEMAGLVHRDLKPANLFVTADGTVRIADLGLACSASPERTRLTALGRAVGSWSFMSPEQYAGEDVIDRRSDHFSLGVCIVALIAGRTPGSQREGPMTIDAAVPLVRPSPPLHTLLQRLLQPDPGRRTADATTLGSAIAEAAAAIGGQGTVPSLELRSTAARLGREDAEETADLASMPVAATASASEALPITADRILIGSARTPARWLVWAGSLLRLGKLRGGDVDLTLRNYPVEAHRDSLDELSRRHAELGRDRDGAWVRDLGSANGTRLDGVRLGQERHTLAPGEEALLDLANQVLLGVRALPGGLVLRRMRNARACGYALLSGTLTIGPPDADLPWPDTTFALRLERRGTQWRLDGHALHEGPLPGLPHAWVRPLELADIDIPEPH